jgi:hypothetical protein
MIYVICFLGGAVVAAAAFGIGLMTYLARIREDHRRTKSLEERLNANAANLSRRTTEFEETLRQHAKEVASFSARIVQYDSLVSENSLLKQDLFNLSVEIKKSAGDHDALSRRQEELDARGVELAQRYLDENVSWISAKLNANNFAGCKKRLLKVLDRVRGIGFDVTAEQDQQLIEDLRANYEQAVRDEFQREEQARIKSQIREEQRLEREIEKQLRDAEREQEAIRKAIERAISESHDEHSAEVERLREKLREAEAKAERAKSQAQLTKSGHVYVISNIGSFGDGVYKIGMTRRLEPLDRVKELGDASVPFPFDVHMMISCDDAPSLENSSHREMHKQRLNKVNRRKEFFRVDFSQIQDIVVEQHGDVDFIAEPEAIQYRESLDMSDDDEQFVEEVMHAVMDDDDTSLDVD